MKLNFLYRFFQLSIIAASGTFPIINENLYAHVDQVGLPPETKIREIVNFDPNSNELPGSIIIGEDSDLYVSFPFINEIRRYTETGSLINTFSLPIPADNLVSGLAVKWNQNIYVVVNSFYSLFTDANGIWEITPKGKIRQFAKIKSGKYPSNLVFDKSDHLYLTDSVHGEILKIDRDGNVSTWLKHHLLKGDPYGSIIAGVPNGASGIVMGKKSKDLYVANTDMGYIVKVKIKQDGSAGKARLFVKNSSLIGVSSISINRRGILYATVPNQNTILGITKKKKIEVISTGNYLEYTNGITMKKNKGINLGFFINGSFINKENPGIFRIKVACDPLHAD